MHHADGLTPNPDTPISLTMGGLHAFLGGLLADGASPDADVMVVDPHGGDSGPARLLAIAGAVPGWSLLFAGGRILLDAVPGLPAPGPRARQTIAIFLISAAEATDLDEMHRRAAK